MTVSPTNRVVWMPLLVGVISFFDAASAFSSTSIRTVLLTGEPTHTAGESVSRLLDYGGLNNLGQTTLTGLVEGDAFSSDRDNLLWQYDPERGLTALLREGDAVSSVPGVFLRASPADSNNQGELSLVGVFSLEGEVYEAVITNAGQEAGFSLIASSTEQAPSTDRTYFNFFDVAIDDLGRTIFGAEPNGFDLGYWAFDPAQGIRLVAIERGEAPGTQESFTSFGSTRFTESGEIHLVGGLVSFNGGASSNAGYWRDMGQGLELVAITNQPVDSSDYRFLNFHVIESPADRDGNAVIVARIIDDTSGSKTAIFFENEGDLSLGLATRSVVSPGGQIFDAFGTVLQNATGDLVVAGALLSETGTVSVWSDGMGDDFTLVVREGDVPPGSELPLSQIGTLAFNDLGQVAFQGEVRGTSGPRPPFFDGIWAQSLEGKLTLIAREGGLLDVSDDPMAPDLRTIVDLTFRSSGLNDRGELLFEAAFSDGTSGLFVSRAVAVPECASLAIAAVSLLTVGTLSRRKLSRF